MSIKIFTDGASRGNPGPGGWGAVVLVSNEVTELGGRENHTTNNRMELTAVIEALSFLEIESDDISEVVSIYTDSSYVLRGAKQWLKGWERGNWQTKTGSEVLNKDLWQRLSRVLEGKKIDWHLVSGHVGIPGNERVDEIATEFADGDNPALFSGPAESYKVDISTVTHVSDKKDKKTASKKRSKAKAFSYVSLVNGEIRIDKTWAECESRVKGVRGAKYKKSLDVEDEKQIVEEFKKA